MKLEEYLYGKSEASILAVAEAQAKLLNLTWDVGVRTVLKAVITNPKQAPNIIGHTGELILSKWLKKYHDGYNNRSSKRASRTPGTQPDPIIDLIINSHLDHLKSDEVVRIRDAHRLAMSAENILGLLLEEFLAIELKAYGWHCCWGETLRSIDFVNVNGSLLQVKNRSNSENSSSVRVRQGTSIEKWHRVDAANGSYKWSKLNLLHDTTKFSEEAFRTFVRRVLKLDYSMFMCDNNL